MHTIRSVALAALAAVLMLQATTTASAQTTKAGDEVSGDLKGTIGLGLIGMEVGLLLPPLFKLQDEWWAWTVFPVVGAAGGAVGGFLAFEGGSPDPKITVPIFAAGIALVIPAIVGSLAIKSRRDAAEIQAARDSGTGLVRLNRGDGNFLRVPALSVASTDNTADRLRFGTAQPRATALHVPLLSGRF